MKGPSIANVSLSIFEVRGEPMHQFKKLFMLSLWQYKQLVDVVWSQWYLATMES